VSHIFEDFVPVLLKVLNFLIVFDVERFDFCFFGLINPFAFLAFLFVCLFDCVPVYVFIS
jgi:hypothetical protein